MHIKILALIAASLAALFSTGCTTTRGAIEAASTKFEIHNGKNKSMVIVLPKEMDASTLHLKIDPATGVLTLDADKLKSSSQAIIESAGAAQAASIAAMSKALSDIAPILAKLAVAAVAPENTVAAAIEATAVP